MILTMWAELVLDYHKDTLWEIMKIHFMSPQINAAQHVFISSDIFKRIFMNEKCSILIRISLKFVRIGLIDSKSALVHVMAWRAKGSNDDPVH